MSIKEKYNTLSIQKRAAIKTAIIFFCIFAVLSFVISYPWIVFPILLLGILSLVVYTMYRVILSNMEYKEKYRK